LTFENVQHAATHCNTLQHTVVRSAASFALARGAEKNAKMESERNAKMASDVAIDGVYSNMASDGGALRADAIQQKEEPQVTAHDLMLSLQEVRVLRFVAVCCCVFAGCCSLVLLQCVAVY